MTLRVLEVCRSFPHHRPGGLEWHAQDVVEGLEAAGARVTVLTTPLPAVPALRELRASGGVRVTGSTPGAYDLVQMRGLRRVVAAVCREAAIDVIHAQGFMALPLAGRRGPTLPPVVATIHGTLFSETPLRRPHFERLGVVARAAALWRHKHRLALWPVWRRFFSEPPVLVTDSRFTVEELGRELGHPVGATVVPLGFDLARHPEVERGEARRRVAESLPPGHPAIARLLDDRARVVVLAGRLEPGKRHALALGAALAAGADVILVAGEGPCRRELEAAAPVHGGVVALLGAVPAKLLPAVFASADIFANADSAAPAFGLVTAEALVAGARCVASASGATSEVLDNPADGELIPVTFDVSERDAWRAAIERALARAEDGNDRAERSRRARARFNRPAMITRLSEVLQSACAKRG